MIWNGLRVALAIFSGKISLKFGLPERRQTLRESIFTGRVAAASDICSAASFGSAALRKNLAMPFAFTAPPGSSFLLDFPAPHRYNKGVKG